MLLISVDEWLSKVHSILNFLNPNSLTPSSVENNVDSYINAKSDRNKSHSLPNLLFPVEEIDFLILEGKSFKINLSEQVNSIIMVSLLILFD